MVAPTHRPGAWPASRDCWALSGTGHGARGCGNRRASKTGHSAHRGRRIQNQPSAHRLRGRPASACEPFRSVLEAGSGPRASTAQRLYQDLVSEHGFTGGYDSVKRFVREWRATTPSPFRRMEAAPGEEVQIDYGQGAWVIEADGTRYRPHLLRLILSASRKGYTEVFRRQTTESFIRGVENGFRAFGGVPATCVIDNMKAAVTRVDWFDPEINPKVRDFAEHYGTVFLPTRPAMPRHKEWASYCA